MMTWYIDTMPTTFSLLLIVAVVLTCLDLLLAFIQYLFEDLMDKLDGMTLFQVIMPVMDYDPFSLTDVLLYAFAGGFFYILAACVLTIFWPIALPAAAIWGIVHFIQTRR